MKKYFLLLTCFPFLYLNQAAAQAYDESVYDTRPFSLALTVSPNISWFRYNRDTEAKSTAALGYSYGLLADFAFAQNYFFSTGLTINNVAADYRINDMEGKYRLQYVELPLTLKLKSTMRYFRSYYGQMGFTGAIKLNSRREENGIIDVGAQADLFRLGLQIGGGVEWLLDHNLRFMTGLSLNNGLTQVVSQNDSRNSFVAINFAIFF